MAQVFGHCAQKICMALAKEVGISEEQAVGMSYALGCGFGDGGVCGCYTAGLLLIGLRYGSFPFATAAEKHALIVEKVNEFEKQYFALQEKLQCRDILGVDVTRGDGMQQAIDSGKLVNICHPLIEKTGLLLGKMFDEDGLKK